jgi:hypothetical protein
MPVVFLREESEVSSGGTSMLYTVLNKREDKHIRTESQACVRRGDRVWRTYREARIWRDRNEPRMGIFGVLADWGADTQEDGNEPFRTLREHFKIVQIEEVIPVWIKDISREIVENARDDNLLDDGYINPDHATPEQEEVYYAKHRDEVMFQLRCLVSLAVYEALETRGMLTEKERRGDERQDGGSSDGALFRDT